jgi:hypothetical protein
MMRTGLTALQVLNANQLSQLSQLEAILSRLTSISVSELQGLGPTASEGDYISQFAQTLAALAGSNAQTQAAQTALVADVHTDNNTSAVLEEAVGYVKFIVAAYRIPEGTVLLGAGPVFSYYEFKQPMDNRLTDEQWTNLLASPNPPPAPAWAGSFTDPVTSFVDSSSNGTNILRLARPARDVNGVHLEWQSQPAVQYRAFYSDDLVNWLLLQTPVTATQSTAGLLDSAATVEKHRFYRVKSVQ